MADDLDDILSSLGNIPGVEQNPSPSTKADFSKMLDELDELPVAISLLDEIVDYPATTYPGEESVTVSTRVPVSWMAQFEEFRDKIGSRMPKQPWKKNSDLFRYFIGSGFIKLRTIQEQMDAGAAKPSPMLAAQLFLEQTGGKLVARAAIRSDAKDKAAKIGEALRDLMVTREYSEAANMITSWYEGARTLRDVSPYWEATMISALVRTPDVPRILTKLCMDGHITDPEIMENYDTFVAEAAKQQQEDLDNLPLTAPASTKDTKDDDTDNQEDRS